MNIVKKKKERGGFLKQKFLQSTNIPSKNNRKALNSHAVVVIGIGLIKSNKKGIVSKKTKPGKSFSCKSCKRAFCDRNCMGCYEKTCRLRP